MSKQNLLNVLKETAQALRGLKFNPYHDPTSGRFGSGGGSGASPKLAPDTGGGTGGGSSSGGGTGFYSTIRGAVSDRTTGKGIREVVFKTSSSATKGRKEYGETLVKQNYKKGDGDDNRDVYKKANKEKKETEFIEVTQLWNSTGTISKYLHIKRTLLDMEEGD